MTNFISQLFLRLSSFFLLQTIFERIFWFPLIVMFEFRKNKSYFFINCIILSFFNDFLLGQRLGLTLFLTSSFFFCLQIVFKFLNEKDQRFLFILTLLFVIIFTIVFMAVKKLPFSFTTFLYFSWPTLVLAIIFSFLENILLLWKI